MGAALRRIDLEPSDASAGPPAEDVSRDTGAVTWDTQEHASSLPVRRELLTISLRNAGKSAPLLLLAGWFVAWLGFQCNVGTLAWTTFVLTGITAGWRSHMAWRHGRQGVALAMVRRMEAQMQGNALLAGITWAVATAGIYPLLRDRDSDALLVILVGSSAVAVHFMTLVRWSYPLLVVPSIGALAMVSLFNNSVQSIPTAVLSVIYALTLLRTGEYSRETAARAIQHGLEVEQANESLRRAKEEAEAGAIAKSQFLATMSHEIRTPMNGVLGSLELLRRSPLSESQQRLVRTAASSGETLMAILNDVLDHSKIEAGKLTLKCEPYSLHELAGSVVGLFRANAEAKGLTLDLRMAPDVPDWVLGDSQRLKQVLLNLVSNAVKFTHRGSVRLSVSCEGVSDLGSHVLFAIEDTGIGISHDGAHRLFAPFQQLNPEGGGARRGTGLGLAISQRIVEAMGGRISVSSRPARGSVFQFSVLLPMHDEEPPTTVMDTASGALDPFHQLAGTVMVVEDDSVSRLIARSMLESLGLHVVEAADGLEALAKASVHTIDVVLMDCHMPNLDGYAATMRWREREGRLGLPRTPIVALTANAFEEDIRRTRHAGMDAHMAKPYSRRQMKDVLSRWL